MSIYSGYKPYLKGKHYEHLLAKILKKHKFFVIRAPSSGARSKFYTPDIVALKNGKAFLIECKYKSDNKSIYFERFKYKEFKYLANLAGSRALICAYYLSLGGFRCLDIDNYDKITEKYVEYSFSSFKEKGIKPEDLDK